MTEQAARRGLCLTEGVTLNGMPATIIGWADNVATVAVTDSDLSSKFTWDHVADIVANHGGRFTGTLRPPAAREVSW